MQFNNEVKVWDPLVRIFHWTLVGALLAAYFTEDDLLKPHVWAGYIVIVAVFFRMFWGFFGSEHAKFKDFVTSPKTAIRYLQATSQLRAKRYIGHNPAGGLMIVIMLTSLLLTTLCGIAAYGAAENSGPMAGWFMRNNQTWKAVLKAAHELSANFILFLAFLHICGVVLESMIHKENLIRAMWTGSKKNEY